MKITPETMKQILELDWAFFQQTRNIGGRASCQNNKETFFLMWTAELTSWTEEMAASWLADLHRAKAEGRNPVTEKYARMMKYTAPEEYAALVPLLPPLDDETVSLARELTAQTVRWAEETARQYPCCCSHARPIHASADGGGVTSLETYTLGEFLTYSPQTLRLFRAYYAEKAKTGENLYLEIQERTARLYGYASLQDAEQKLSNPQDPAKAQKNPTP